MDPTNKPQILEHVNKSLAITIYDTKCVRRISFPRLLCFPSTAAKLQTRFSTNVPCTEKHGE